MKTNIKIGIVAIVALLCGQVVNAQKKHDLTVKLSHPSKPGVLNADLFTGSVKITGYAGNEVVITSSLPNDPDKISTAEKDNIVKLKVEQPTVVDFTIMVPRNFSVVLKILAAGNVTIDNLTGDQDIAISAGDVTMTNIDGSVSVNTKKGNVTVDMAPKMMNNAITLSNVQGIISLTIPTTQKANVKLQTEFAKVTSDFEIEKPSADQPSNKHIEGKINGGGSEILMRSVGGSIYLRKKK